MEIGTVPAADDSSQIIFKESIGLPPICGLPRFNGKTNNIVRPTNSFGQADLFFLVRPIFFFWSVPIDQFLPLVSVIRQLVELALMSNQTSVYTISPEGGAVRNVIYWKLSMCIFNLPLLGFTIKLGTYTVIAQNKVYSS